jgi:hypothetical protein
MKWYGYGHCGCDVWNAAAIVEFSPRGWKATSMDKHCQCDNPDASLLRVVMIGEIVRVEEADLYAMAEALNALGFMRFSDTDAEPLPPPAARATDKKARGLLRRVK